MRVTWIDSQSAPLNTAARNAFIGKMSGRKSWIEEHVWTRENLQILFASLKDSIPASGTMCAYLETMHTVNWNKVAFPPFSPKQCKEKWKRISKNIRRTRSLLETINEVEDVLSHRSGKIRINPYLLKVPSTPSALFYEENWARFYEQHPEMSCGKLDRFIRNEYKMLPEEEKSIYEEKFRLANEEYKRQMLEIRKIRMMKRISADSIDGVKRKVAHLTFPGEPTMPPRYCRSVFCREQMQLLKEKYPDPTERFRKAILMWRHLPDKEKEPYQEKLRENFKKYSMDLQKWFKSLKAKDQDHYLTYNRTKYRLLCPKRSKIYETEEISMCRPSDSEDEDTEYSSSDEEEDYKEDEEEEEEEDNCTFELF